MQFFSLLKTPTEIWLPRLRVCLRQSNRTVHIRHQCMKTTVLSCHRCLINTCWKKWTTFKNIHFQIEEAWAAGFDIQVCPLRDSTHCQPCQKTLDLTGSEWQWQTIIYYDTKVIIIISQELLLVQGREQLGGRLRNTRKWIGATEIVAFLTANKVKTELLDFHVPSARDGTHPRLFQVRPKLLSIRNKNL